MELTKTNFLSNKITYLFLIFIISRFFYLNFLNITFDNWTIDIYWQFFPKDLLENDLLNSIYFNHWQAPFLNLFVGIMMKFSNHYFLIIQFIYLIIGFLSFVLIFLISKNFDFSENFSFLLSATLMILPTTILYENHLYKEYVTFFLLLWLFYSTIKILKTPNSLKYILYLSFSLSLLCLTRETFHIFWGYILIIILQKNLNIFNKLLLFFIFTIFVMPFYLKNLILFDKFAINTTSLYEHLNQKIDYVKEMEDPYRHKKIRDLTFGSHQNYLKFKKKTSILYDIKINSSAEFYKNYLNYKSKYNNKLLNSNTSFSEVYFEVDKYRKKDFLLVLKEEPLLIIVNIINSITRHLFTSSDYFNFTKHNADKMSYLIKFSDCIKLTPICIYEYEFDWKTVYTIDGQSFKSIDTGPLNYKEKIIYSLQYTNFLLVVVYVMLLFFLIKSLFSKKDKETNIINFWLFTFIFIFSAFVIFEDGEIARHRFPFDYLCFLIFLKQIKEYFSKKKF